MSIIDFYKKENGITLISLVVTIVITMLISAVAINTGISTRKRAVYFEAVAELKIMQSEINSLYEEYKDGNNEILNYGSEVTESLVDSENKKVSKLEETALNSLGIDEENRSGYRYFSSEYINNTLKIAGVERDFFIDLEKRSVVLTNGVKYGGKVYYALSQVKDGGYNVDYIQEEIAEEQIEEEGLAEAPVVSGKEMIPVVWNQGMLSWVKADVTWNEYEKQWKTYDTEYKWYDYSKNNKKWANIVLVEENGINTREYYEQCKAGTEIKMDDILCMYVWIPRFENINTYYTNNTYSVKATKETRYVSSKVKFIGKDSQADEGYEINKAFTYVDGSGNTVNLEGFWIGKFEASNYTSKQPDSNIGYKYGGPIETDLEEDETNVLGNYIKIKPNLTSWRSIPIKHDSLENIKHIMPIIARDEQNIYGIESSAQIGLVTIQMWNAVASLAQSKYGNRVDSVNNDVYGNFYCQGDQDICYTTLTGMVSKKGENDYSGETDANGGIEHLIVTKREEYNGHVIINEKYNHYEYWTEIGQKGSTSSNVYGVYDMVGGAYEYTMNMPNNFFNRNGELDLNAQFYLTGGTFYQITASNYNQTNIFYKYAVSNIEDVSRVTSFRTGLFISK